MALRLGVGRMWLRQTQRQWLSFLLGPNSGPSCSSWRECLPLRLDLSAKSSPTPSCSAGDEEGVRQDILPLLARDGISPFHCLRECGSSFLALASAGAPGPVMLWGSGKRLLLHSQKQPDSERSPKSRASGTLRCLFPELPSHTSSGLTYRPACLCMFRSEPSSPPEG